MEIQLDGTKPFVLDKQHVVAWSESLDYDIKVASGIFSFTTSEGVVNEFYGTGTIMIQTRNIERLAGLISPFVRTGS